MNSETNKSLDWKQCKGFMELVLSIYRHQIQPNQWGGKGASSRTQCVIDGVDHYGRANFECRGYNENVQSTVLPLATKSRIQIITILKNSFLKL